MAWRVDLFDGVEDEIGALPVGLSSRIVRLLHVVEDLGVENLREPHAKHLEGKLWELRAKAPEGIARGIYVAVAGRRIVVLHVFVKKSDKTPARALQLARDRLRRLPP